MKFVDAAFFVDGVHSKRWPAWIDKDSKAWVSPAFGRQYVDFRLIPGVKLDEKWVWADGDEYHGCMFVQQKPNTDILGKFNGRIRFVSCNLHNVFIDKRVDYDDCLVASGEIEAPQVPTRDETDHFIDRVGVDAVMEKLGGERVKEYITKTPATDAKFEEMKAALVSVGVTEEKPVEEIVPLKAVR